MQKKMSQRDSFQKRSGFTSFFMVDKETSKGKDEGNHLISY